MAIFQPRQVKWRNVNDMFWFQTRERISMIMIKYARNRGGAGKIPWMIVIVRHIKLCVAQWTGNQKNALKSCNLLAQLMNSWKDTDITYFQQVPEEKLVVKLYILKSWSFPSVQHRKKPCVYIVYSACLPNGFSP